ncbi:hypothetical protein MMC25_006810 [Agyrium rufum]|nr:hypothetical protein [Agyrium rufum]
METFDVYTTTASEVLMGLGSGHFTSEGIVQAYLAQINKRNDRLRAVLEVAPNALKEASKRDEERIKGITLGVLHGLPILIKVLRNAKFSKAANLTFHKGNIATRPDLHMGTTSGNFALSGSRPRENAAVVKRAKRVYRIDEIPAGWSPIGGQGQNAYVRHGLQPGDPTFSINGPGGSSSGPAIGVSAGFAPAAIGTETSGSLIFPADRAALYTIKPTPGLIPQAGIVPVSYSFDTAGPMAKFSRNVALLLDVLVDATKTKIREILAAYELVGTKAEASHKVTFKSWPTADALAKGYGPLMGKIFIHDYQRDFESYLNTVDNCRIKHLQDILDPDDTYAALSLPNGDQAGREALSRAISNPTSDEEAQTADQEMRRLSRTHGIDGALEEHDVDVLLGPDSGPLYKIAAAAGYPMATLPLSYLDENGCPFGLVAIARAHQEARLVQLQSAWEEVIGRRRAPGEFEGWEA